MFENIPKNWKKEKLENIATVNYGTRIVKDSAIGNEYYVYGGGDKTFKTDIFNRENTLIVARFGMSPKCTRFVKGKFFLNDSGLTVDTNDEHLLNQNFLNWQLFFLNDLIYSLGKGVAQKNLNVSLFKNLDIIVPKSLNEQQEIVDVLDAAYRIISLRKECIESAQFLIPALFQEMFGDPINNNKNYPCESLKKLCSKIGSGATPRGGKESYLKEGISFVRSMNVHDGIFQYKDLAFINDEQAKLLDNVELQESDVLINITGASVARTCIVPKEILPARVNQHVSILRCTGRLNPYFLNVLLYFQTTKQKLLDLANSKGATREAITKQQLELFKIILPPIEQQELFAEKVQEIEAYIKTQHEELENAKTMFQSLLHHSFTGELTRHKFGGDANG